MAGSRGTRLAPDLPPGPRAALVIATTMYQDPELRQLRAPAHDAQDLAETLADPGIGGFTVTRMIDADEGQARRAIDVFLSGRGVGDVVVVYLSCHGVLDRRNRLYFAAADTIKTQLSSTGIPSAWLLEELEECRARQQVLILDCCFSGAFAHGSKGDADLDLERRLAAPGRGQAVLTASRAGEYSFEGQAVPGVAVSGSVFTTGLVEGLRTGAADAGGDGYVSVDEAYDYAYRYVQASGASQTPQRWLSGGEGAIVLARSPAGIAITPAALPEDLAASFDSRYPGIRIAAVHELGGWLAGDDPARAMTGEQKLREIADTDNPAVAAAARVYLARPNQPTAQPGPHAHERIWDLAISYASEDESLAREIHEQLRDRFDVFYAPAQHAPLWGSDLNGVLPNTYGVQSSYVLVLSTQNYVDKYWTKVEYDAVASHAPNRILLLDMGALPADLPSGLVYRGSSAAEMVSLVDALQQKLTNHHDPHVH